jgi:hypothetical protein
VTLDNTDSHHWITLIINRSEKRSLIIDSKNCPLEQFSPAATLLKEVNTEINFLEAEDQETLLYSKQCPISIQLAHQMTEILGTEFTGTFFQNIILKQVLQRKYFLR